MTWATQVPTLFRDTSFDTQIDRLFDEAVRAVSGWESAWEPDCNVYEDANHFYVQVAVPGIEPSQIDVQVEDQLLRIKGERKSEPSGDVTWYAHEFPCGPFSCSFRLPSYVDHGKSTASYKHGVLTIMFPKYEEAKPRRIMIEAA